MRRALFILALAACARRQPESAVSDPNVDPLVVGRSAASAVPEKDGDAGLAVETWMLVAPDAGDVRAACIRAIGSNGAVSADQSCVVEQEYDRPQVSTNVPVLRVWGSPRDAHDPKIKIGFSRNTVPAVGVQPPGSFFGFAVVEKDDSKWQASTSAHNAMGAVAVTLASVRVVKHAGRTAYEMHGRVDAQLIPTVEGGGIGWIDLHAEF